MKIGYIGRGQTAVMLTLFGVIFCVLNTTLPDMGTSLADISVSVMIMAVMLIPLAVLSAKGEKSVPELCTVRLGSIGRVINILFFIYFITAAAHILKRYSEFVSERYFPEADQAVCIIMLGAVCVYIAHTGVETVCRMSTVLLFMLCVLSVIFLLGAWKDILSFDRTDVTVPKLSLQRGLGGLFPIGAAGCTCLCVMCGGMGKRTRSGAYGGIAAMLAVSVLITAAVYMTLGGYITVSEYPLADSAVYAARGGTFRNDGLFFSLWTVMCAAVISLLCACGGHSLKQAAPAVKLEGLISGTAAVICALSEMYFGLAFCQMIYEAPLPPLILTAAVPLILLIFGKGKRR
ncbi:MAG: GerAB/ArcD/ProY family transporter [Huintestinicola sp.]|uniref:GerAB/ArcD/ProY family transporter n=1 Tax=Huintestinicola sp. TaxID=2981661 RepID=UPI003F11FFC3